MKKLNTIILTLSIMFMSAVSFAQIQDSHLKAAEEMLALMEVDKTLTNMFNQMQQMQMDYIKRYAPPDANEEQINLVQEYRVRIGEVMREFYDWNKIKDDYVKLYAEFFTEEEIREVISFYQSTVGQKFIKQQPALMEKSMVIKTFIFRE